MNYIQDLRISLGLNQSDFANTLGLSRAAVSLAEIGKRVLPTDALIKAGQMHRQASKAQENDEEQAKTAFELKNHLSDRLSKKRMLLKSTDKALKKMIAHHVSAFERLKLLKKEKILFDGVPTYLSSLEIKITETERLIAKTHPLYQQLMTVKKKELEAIIKVLEKEVNDGIA